MAEAGSRSAFVAKRGPSPKDCWARWFAAPKIELAGIAQGWRVRRVTGPKGQEIYVEREVDANLEARLEGKKGERFTLLDVRKGELPLGKRGA